MWIVWRVAMAAKNNSTHHYFSRPRRLLSTPSGRTMNVDPKAGVDKAAYMTHDGSGIRKALDSYAMVDTKWHAVW